MAALSAALVLLLSSTSGLRQALDAALSPPQTVDAKVSVTWLREGSMSSATVFGNGVVLTKIEQVSVPAERVRQLLESFRAAGFAEMPERYGEEASERLDIRGKVTLRVGREEKTVVQLLAGPRSTELERLANETLALANGRGVRISNLDDGLRKIGDGRLAPEALRVVAQRRGSPSGWLLRVEGREAVAQPFGTAGFGEARRRTLEVGEVRALARALVKQFPMALPQVVGAHEDSELAIEVLDQTKDVQGRTAVASEAMRADHAAAYEALLAPVERVALATLKERS
jgi:hypothetical protein